MDGAILLVDGSQGPQHQTKEHILLAKQIGVGQIVVFINKVDVADPELLELVVSEVEDALALQGYQGSPIVKGAAKLAYEDPAGSGQCVRDLLAAMQSHFPDPVRDYQSPFMMPVEDVFTIGGRGTVVTGRIERGQVRKGDQVEIVGLSALGEAPRQVVVTGVQMFHKDLEVGSAGENVGLLLRGVAREEVQRGQLIVAPGSVMARQKAKADLYLIPTKEGGRHTKVFSGYRPQFFFGTTDVTGTIGIGAEGGTMEPGDHGEVSVELTKPVGMERGSRFIVREGSKTVGVGMVTSVE
jgi:elongation factor Tu